MVSVATDITFPGILLTIVGLIILWIIVSIQVWIAGKTATAGKATFGRLFLPHLQGQSSFLSSLSKWTLSWSGYWLNGFVFRLHPCANRMGLIFKASFETGWLQAILIAILAWDIFIVLSIIVGTLFGIAYPTLFFPRI